MQGVAPCHFNSFIQNKLHGMMSNKSASRKSSVKKTQYSKQRKSCSIWATEVNSVHQQFKRQIEVAQETNVYRTSDNYFQATTS